MSCLASNESSEVAPLIFLDIETTGLSESCGIWEVAYVTAHVEGSSLVLEKAIAEFLPIPLDAVMEQKALEITHFDDRYPWEEFTPLDAETEDSWIEFFLERLTIASRGRHLVGAVPSFDTIRLNKLYREHLLPTAPWHYHLIDVENLIAGKYGIMAPWKSAELFDRCRVTLDETKLHQAAYDVELVIQSYAHVYDLKIERQ